MLITLLGCKGSIGSWQLGVTQVVQNRHVGEQGNHWDNPVRKLTSLYLLLSSMTVL